MEISAVQQTLTGLMKRLVETDESKLQKELAGLRDELKEGDEKLEEANSKFKNALIQKAGASKISCTLKKLRKGKKYYVRIRAYRNDGDNVTYGAYSGKIQNISKISTAFTEKCQKFKHIA